MKTRKYCQVTYQLSLCSQDTVIMWVWRIVVLLFYFVFPGIRPPHALASQQIYNRNNIHRPTSVLRVTCYLYTSFVRDVTDRTEDSVPNLCIDIVHKHWIAE